MSLSGLALGALCQPDWDTRPFRIIGLDEHEVFYDCQSEDGLWTFWDNYRRTCVFYRVSTAFFAQRSQRIGDMPLAPEELAAFRPDLPMRLGRSNDLCWNRPWSKEAIEQASMPRTISANAVVLVPYGPKGALKTGVIVRSSGEDLEVPTLLLEAKRIQEANNAGPSKGVGLCRLGWQKRLPSYYIGAYLDRAGHVR
ncbi:MAG: hypothetical protein ABI599_02710 [Flavobacteriales bacterium]